MSYCISGSESEPSPSTWSTAFEVSSFSTVSKYRLKAAERQSPASKISLSDSPSIAKSQAKPRLKPCALARSAVGSPIAVAAALSFIFSPAGGKPCMSVTLGMNSLSRPAGDSFWKWKKK